MENSGKSKSSISKKLHSHSYHVLIRKKPKQLSGKATVPDSVISRCQTNKYDTGLLSIKKILFSLGHRAELLVENSFGPPLAWLNCDYKRSSPNLENFESAQTEKKSRNQDFKAASAWTISSEKMESRPGALSGFKY